jgi:hypothetical protein
MEVQKENGLGALFCAPNLPVNQVWALRRYRFWSGTVNNGSSGNSPPLLKAVVYLIVIPVAPAVSKVVITPYVPAVSVMPAEPVVLAEMAPITTAVAITIPAVPASVIIAGGSRQRYAYNRGDSDKHRNHY